MQPHLFCNWKTYLPSEEQAAQIAAAMKQTTGVTVALFPSMLHIPRVASVIEGSGILLGAQDISRNSTAPHTGRASGEQLTSIGVTHVLVGHVETRNSGVTNAMVVEKVRHAHESNLVPVLCVSDTDGRDPMQEVSRALDSLTHPQAVIVYEPSDHVGTDRACNEEHIAAVCDQIRSVLQSIAPETPVLYGGSVNEANAKQIMTNGSVDGFLIGRASIDQKEILALSKSLC
ncbi:MAG: triose-phosphate isomerase [Candidatus Kaiserbacteria bacterium]|nr:triose-phosphate isomerase [Candidatus Kaiserbacteria bacterium]